MLPGYLINNHDISQSNTPLGLFKISCLQILLITLFFVSTSSQAIAGVINLTLTNAINGKPVPNSEILVLQQQPDQSWKPLKKYTTNTLGTADLDLPGLGEGTSYQLRAKPYTTGYAFSKVINQPGSFNFKVGRLEVQVIEGKTGNPFPNHKITAREILTDGTQKWVASGMTEANGIIRFDLPMAAGKKFVLSAVSSGDGQYKYSDTITSNGKTVFTVGNKLLNLTLTNAINGKPVPNSEILVLQQQPDQSWKPLKKYTTNTLGTADLDLPGLGEGTSYQLRAKPYTTGYAFSKVINQPGSFNFKVGKVLIKLTNALNNQPFANQKITLYKKTSDGKLHWHRSGNTTLNGTAYFDPDDVKSDAVYIASTTNIFGNNKTFYSPLITSGGVINFSVSPNESNSTDLNPPVITFLSPTQNSLVSDAGFLIKAHVEEKNKVSSVVVKINDPVKGESNGNAQLIKGQWNYLVSADQLTSQQEVSITLTAYDDSFNEGTVTRNFHVIKDTEKPKLFVNSHKNQNQVSENGFLLSGVVSDNTMLRELRVTVIDPLLGHITNNKSLEISKNGHWSLSVNQASREQEISVLFTASDFANNQRILQLSLKVTSDAFKTVQLLNRITFGATPELLEEIKTIGLHTFLEQQLNPTLIDNFAFKNVISTLGNPDSKIALKSYQLAHAIYSKKQLLEVMTWFWENHFSTSIKKTGTQREFVQNKNFREHALGNFRDLLGISATSPAMMVYLDNRLSKKDEPNENFARELLELHTLGVGGGYTRQDIQEVAKVLTGWRVVNDQFYFQSSAHDYNEKNILGYSFPAGVGKEEGDNLFDILSTHPSTAHFICTKLLKVFVSDTPTSTSIDNCSADFLNNATQNNQIALVLKNIFNSEEFSASTNFHNKVKTPLEMIAGFSRQLEVKTSLNKSVNSLAAMGMDLFQNPMPAGYPEIGTDWVNSNRYLQYVKFISTTAFNKAYKTRNYIEDPAEFFKKHGYETASGIVGYLFYLALSNDYSLMEWNVAIDILTDKDTIIFDIDSDDANERIRSLIATVLNFPAYQLQ